MVPFGTGAWSSVSKARTVLSKRVEDAKESGQLEGWNQVLDKLAAVLTDLAQAK